MKHLLWRSVLTVVLKPLLLGTPTSAPQAAEKAKPKAGAEKSAAATDGVEIEEEAKAILTRWADVLAKTPRLSVTAETGYDAVQPSGQKIEFGSTITFTISRPDHLRIDFVQRDGSHRSFRFDGKAIAVFDEEDKVYATVEKPGTFQVAEDYFID